MMETATNKAEVQRDAKNRALRTLIQGLGLDVVVALIVFLAPVVAQADGFGDLSWSIVGFSLVKTVLTTGLSYLMRVFLDKSRIPTPLPPSEPGEPDADVGA